MKDLPEGDAEPAARCGADARENRRMRLGRALEAGFGVQYWGTSYDAEGLADQAHGLLILELTRHGVEGEQGERRFAPDEISRIRRDGARPVLAYLNIGEIEIYRDYYHRDIAAAKRPAWWGMTSSAGEHLSAYWSDAWRDAMLARVDALMASGVDGLFLDDVMHYFTHAAESAPTDGADTPKGYVGHAAAMMDLVTALAERARQHGCGALVVVNNAVFIGRDAGADHADAFDHYRAAIDAVLIENALGPEGHPDTFDALAEDYQSQGLRVLSIDIAQPDTAADLARKAEALGIVPYIVGETSFSRLYAPSSGAGTADAGARSDSVAKTR